MSTIAFSRSAGMLQARSHRATFPCLKSVPVHFPTHSLKNQPRRVKLTRCVVVKSAKGFQPDTNDPISTARKTQRAATDVLAALLQAPDPATAVTEFSEDLTEEFFMIASTYLDMAKKEGNKEMVAQMTAALEVAFAEKQKSLRGEIRLLNNLLRADNPLDRGLVFMKEGEFLVTDDEYFFKLLAKMTSDVEMQKGNPKRESLLEQLKAISEEASIEKEKFVQDAE